MTRVLVTGGAGYVGSHTAKALAASGIVPIVYDSLEAGRSDFVRWGPLVRGDVLDRAALVAAIRAHAPAAILHFAGRIAVGESVVRPDLHYRTNVGGTLAILEAMRETDVRTIIFSSSAAVYGTPTTVPIREDSAITPLSPYGHSKATAEVMIRDFSAAFGLQWLALRYFNAAGADPDGELGEQHEPETHAVPLAILAAMGHGTFRVFGNDYATPDGTALRDYVHVSDLADAHVLGLRHLNQGGASAAVNLGGERARSVREIITAVESFSGRRVPISDCARRPGDPPELLADIGVARRLLRWRPTRSDLSVIVETAWQWHARTATHPSQA